MKVEVLNPSCNPATIRDGRGGIFTWVPPEPVVEFNLIYYSPGKIRGLHYHPQFVEYLLIVEGIGTLMVKDNKDDPDGSEEVIHLSKGTCVRVPVGVVHTLYAITQMTAVAMLTKKWDDCAEPAIRVAELPK